MAFINEGMWFTANPRPTPVKMLVLTMSQTVAESRSLDINTASKRNHRASGLVQSRLHRLAEGESGARQG